MTSRTQVPKFIGSTPSNNKPVSAPDHLPGSRFDHAPLLTCDKCKRRREQSGGVFCGARFMCRACFSGRYFKAVSAPQG